mmetsp:Transcript_11336/g.15826  ORF Transcript_11336/g.15826 Transcript_11336/m.15826 type:complete len:89 (-) Transcript_11336:125-391(-)
MNGLGLPPDLKYSALCRHFPQQMRRAGESQAGRQTLTGMKKAIKKRMVFLFLEAFEHSVCMRIIASIHSYKATRRCVIALQSSVCALL